MSSLVLSLTGRACFIYTTREEADQSKTLAEVSAVEVNKAKLGNPKKNVNSATEQDMEGALRKVFWKLETKITQNFLLMWKEKKELFFKGVDGDEDFWCFNCGILYWSYNDLTDHILKKYTVSKMDYRCLRKAPLKTTNTKCYECSNTFISVKKLHIHMESVHY